MIGSGFRLEKKQNATRAATLLMFLPQKSRGQEMERMRATRFEWKEDWAHYLK